MYHIVNSPQNHNNGTKMWKEILNFYTTKFAKKTHADHLQFFQQPDGFNLTLDQYKSKCHEVLTSLQMRTADGPTKFPEHELFKNIIGGPDTMYCRLPQQIHTDVVWPFYRTWAQDDASTDAVKTYPNCKIDDIFSAAQHYQEMHARNNNRFKSSHHDGIYSVKSNKSRR